MDGHGLLASGWFKGAAELMDGHFVAGFVAGVCTTLVGVLVLTLLVVVVRRLLALRHSSTRAYRPVSLPSRRHPLGDHYDDGDNDNAPLVLELTDLARPHPTGVFEITHDEDGEDRGSTPSPSKWALDDLPAIEPDYFQQLWTENEVRDTIEVRLRPGVDVERVFTRNRIACIASGTVGSQVKYYFFAQKGQLCFLVEVLVSSTSHQMAAKIKCEDGEAARLFAQHLRYLLATT